MYYREKYMYYWPPVCPRLHCKQITLNKHVSGGRFQPIAVKFSIPTLA